MPDFRDCTGRQIQIGDVLARTCVQGGMMLGIVMGFKGKKLIVEVVEVHKRDYRGEISSWSMYTSYWSHKPKHCVVTEIPSGRFGISHPHSTAMFVSASTVASPPPVFSRYQPPES